MKFKTGVSLFIVSVLAGWSMAGPVHTWATGEYITATDLNAAITHIHANLGHGHGPVIVNSDISGSASIAHTKLATPAVLPKAWVSLATACGSGTCDTVDSSVVTSVTWSAAGTYTVNFPTRTDANYGTLVTAFGARLVNCATAARTATTASVVCVTSSTGAEINAAFTFVLLDSGN